MKTRKLKPERTRYHGRNRKENLNTNGKNSVEGNPFRDECACGLDALIPSCTPWIIYACVFAFRLHHVNQKENWWILHPDEIFQSVEG